jgi:hypothetical protein
MDDESDDVRDARLAARGTPYLTSKQAAFYLGLQDRGLADMRRRGTGPRFVRLGRCVRYHIRDIVAFAKEADGTDNQHV